MNSWFFHIFDADTATRIRVTPTFPGSDGCVLQNANPSETQTFLQVHVNIITTFLFTGFPVRHNSNVSSSFTEPWRNSQVTNYLLDTYLDSLVCVFQVTNYLLDTYLDSPACVFQVTNYLLDTYLDSPACVFQVTNYLLDTYLDSPACVFQVTCWILI